MYLAREDAATLPDIRPDSSAVYLAKGAAVALPDSKPDKLDLTLNVPDPLFLVDVEPKSATNWEITLMAARADDAAFICADKAVTPETIANDFAIEPTRPDSNAARDMFPRVDPAETNHAARTARPDNNPPALTIDARLPDKGAIPETTVDEPNTVCPRANSPALPAAVPNAFPIAAARADIAANTPAVPRDATMLVSCPLRLANPPIEALACPTETPRARKTAVPLRAARALSIRVMRLDSAALPLTVGRAYVRETLKPTTAAELNIAERAEPDERAFPVKLTVVIIVKV